ncbi:hypothetical protein LMG9673_04742 [Ralstonia pseudosolanacearum]|nr:hypothetical protein LMG9673_04742 [Ralstonia pseudosolanacearum]
MLDGPVAAELKDLAGKLEGPVQARIRGFDLRAAAVGRVAHHHARHVGVIRQRFAPCDAAIERHRPDIMPVRHRRLIAHHIAALHLDFRVVQVVAVDLAEDLELRAGAGRGIAMQHPADPQVHLGALAAVDDRVFEPGHRLAIARAVGPHEHRRIADRHAPVDAVRARALRGRTPVRIGRRGNRQLVIQMQRRIDDQRAAHLVLAGVLQAGVVCRQRGVPALVGARLEHDVRLADPRAGHDVEARLRLARQAADGFQRLVQIALVQQIARPRQQRHARPADVVVRRIAHGADAARQHLEPQRARGQVLLGDQHARGDIAVLDERVVGLQLDRLQRLLAHALAVHGLEQIRQPVEDVVFEDDALDGETRCFLGQGGQRNRLSGCGRCEDVGAGVGAVAGLVGLLLLQALHLRPRAGNRGRSDLGKRGRSGRSEQKDGQARTMVRHGNERIGLKKKKTEQLACLIAARACRRSTRCCRTVRHGSGCPTSCGHLPHHP